MFYKLTWSLLGAWGDVFWSLEGAFWSLEGVLWSLEGAFWSLEGVFWSLLCLKSIMGAVFGWSGREILATDLGDETWGESWLEILGMRPGEHPGETWPEISADLDKNYVLFYILTWSLLEAWRDVFWSLGDVFWSLEGAFWSLEGAFWSLKTSLWSLNGIGGPGLFGRA